MVGLQESIVSTIFDCMMSFMQGMVNGRYLQTEQKIELLHSLDQNSESS